MVLSQYTMDASRVVERPPEFFRTFRPPRDCVTEAEEYWQARHGGTNDSEKCVSGLPARNLWSSHRLRNVRVQHYRAGGFAAAHRPRQETILPTGPLEYHFIAAEDRLVVRVFNRGNEPLKFVGEQSSMVDPAGLSHALRSLTIPPQSHMKLIIPRQPTSNPPALASVSVSATPTPAPAGPPV